MGLIDWGAGFDSGRYDGRPPPQAPTKNDDEKEVSLRGGHMRPLHYASDSQSRVGEGLDPTPGRTTT